MKKLLIILLTFLLMFSPIITATPILTEEALIIPTEDLGDFIEVFVLLKEYDDLLNKAMSNYYNLNEYLRENVNKKIEDKEINSEMIILMSYYFSNSSLINDGVFEEYIQMLNTYEISKEIQQLIKDILKISSE